MSRKIYDKTKSHSGEYFGDTGQNSHDITIPSGYKFRSATIDSARGNSLGIFWLTSTPSQGSSGSQRIKVQWAYPPLGKVRYRLRAYAVEVEEEILSFDILHDSNWKEKADEAVANKTPFRLTITGDLAGELMDALGIKTEASHAVDPVSLGIIASVIGLGFIATALVIVLSAAIIAGCDVKAVGTEENDDGEKLLYFDVKCQ